MNAKIAWKKLNSQRRKAENHAAFHKVRNFPPVWRRWAANMQLFRSILHEIHTAELPVTPSQALDGLVYPNP